MLELGADLGRDDWRGSTALHYAAEKGNLEILNLLLDKGVSTESKDMDGLTPLYMASRMGHLPGQLGAVKKLLEYGAQPDAKDNDGWTALHSAAEMNRGEAALALIEAGASCNAKNKDGDTPLHFAAGMGVTDVVRAPPAHPARPAAGR